MIRKLMASSAVIALMSAGAISFANAQTDPAKPAVSMDTAAAQDTATPTVADSSQPIAPEHPTLATAIIGRSVYSSSDPESDNIGDVNDLIVDNDGSVTHAIVGVGGFLGIGEKNVAVPFDQLKVVEQDGDFRLVYAATKDQLESAPAFDRTAYDPAARAPANAVNTATNDATGVGPAPLAPAGDMTAAPADQMATDNVAPATDTMADNAASSDNTQPLNPEVGFTSASVDQVRASTLMGKSVYGSDNQSIGEISDLVLQKEGGTRVALIDVGGFLGIGEKTVAIPFSDLKITKADANATPQVTVAMSKDQLQALPTYDTKALDDNAAVDTTTTDTMASTQPADNMAAPANQMATTDQATADQNDVTTDQGMAANDNNQMTTGSVSPTQDMAASTLIGAEVYGTDKSDIGKVGDIVFDTKGDIDAVVVDVGGFLGIGTKPVALNFDNLNIQNDGNGNLMVSVNATKDQLNNAPAYKMASE